MWIVTFVALSLAIGMSMVAMRLLRGDRHRSAARVSALAAAALAYPEDDAFADEPMLHRADPDEAAFDGFREPDSQLFAATVAPPRSSRRWIAVCVVALVMAGIGGGVYVFLAPTALGATGARAASVTPTVAATAVRTPAQNATPIELISLKHTTDASTFSVAGLVQNPTNGAPFTHVIAVVYLFDNDGRYFATGRADLEFRGLRPGEEAPFTISIPNTAQVGRYRVGFRREDGSVIAHVDKRNHPAATSMTEGKHP